MGDGEEDEDLREARLNIAANSRSSQNFATRVMSNGVEVIVAGNFYLYLQFVLKSY